MSLSAAVDGAVICAKRSRRNLKSIYDQIQSNPDAGQRWLTLLNVSSTYRPVPANGMRTLECAIAALDPASYQACYCPHSLSPSREMKIA